MFLIFSGVDDPGEPILKNCPLKVREGDNVTCTCSTQHEGSPPPVIRWAGHTPSSTLHLYGVTREHNTSTCEIIWGNQTKTVSYNILVRSELPVSYHILQAVFVFLPEEQVTFSFRIPMVTFLFLRDL